MACCIAVCMYSRSAFRACVYACMYVCVCMYVRVCICIHEEDIHVEEWGIYAYAHACTHVCASAHMEKTYHAQTTYTEAQTEGWANAFGKRSEANAPRQTHLLGTPGSGIGSLKSGLLLSNEFSCSGICNSVASSGAWDRDIACASWRCSSFCASAHIATGSTIWSSLVCLRDRNDRCLNDRCSRDIRLPWNGDKGVVALKEAG